MDAGQYIAIIGGKDAQFSNLRNVEVVMISDEGVVSPSTCQLPYLQVALAAISGNLICGGNNHDRTNVIQELNTESMQLGVNPDTTNECQELSPEAMKWKEQSPMKKKRYRHAMTNANNQTYVCGGFDESLTRLNSCEKFHGEWSYIKDLPTRLASHCLIGTEDSIYLIGGWENQGVS